MLLWQNMMEAMGLIAVLVNCALIGLSGPVHRMFPEMSTTQTILLIVALEVSIVLVTIFSKVIYFVLDVTVVFQIVVDVNQ